MPAKPATKKSPAKPASRLDIVDALAAATGITKKEADATVDAVIEQITALTIKSGKLAIRGFGAFAVKDRPARTGRNPATGETITVAATKKFTFTAAKQLKERL